MTSNLLSLLPKTTTYITIRDALQDLITNQYNQFAGIYEKDIQAWQSLRDSICSAEDLDTTLDNLISYYGQLCYLVTKLPPELDILWSWRSAHTPDDRAIDDLNYERVNVLFNIAVTYSQLGQKENRATAEGLKKAHQHFQNAAGSFRLLETLLAESPYDTEDLQEDYLGFLQSAMLAQAQECIWQRAVIDQMKDKLIAQLSEQVSQLYGKAHTALQKSTAVTAAWIHHLAVKRLHFAAAAQFRMSTSAVSNSQYGEEVSRLRIAAACCAQAMKSITYVNSAVAQDLGGLTDRVQNTLGRAEKDNDMIYVVPVPSPESLGRIVPTLMVKPTAAVVLTDPLKTISREQLIFASLVPFVIRNVSDIFEQRRENLINALANQSQSQENQMQALLQELGLPGSLSALEQPRGLPQSILAQSEEVRNCGGVAHLLELTSQLDALALADTELVEQITDLFECEEDLPNSEMLTSLRSQINQYEGFLEQAKASDDLVKEKLVAWESKIALLASSEAELSRQIPDTARVVVSPANRLAAQAVRTVLDRWDRVFAAAGKTLRDLKAFAMQDSIMQDLTSKAQSLEAANFGQPLKAEDFEEIVAKRLQPYTKQTVSEDHDGIMADLRVAHAKFMETKSDPAKATERERVLQDLDMAYHKFRDIVHNLQEGSKFYTDFHKAFNRLGDEVAIAIKDAKDNQLSSATEKLQLKSGVWSPEKGIAFSTPSNVAKSSKSYTYDPSKHSVVFKTKS